MPSFKDIISFHILLYVKCPLSFPEFIIYHFWCKDQRHTGLIKLNFPQK